MNYEQAFGEVCKVIEEHPELWDRPSRDAVTFVVNTLWKNKTEPDYCFKYLLRSWKKLEADYFVAPWEKKRRRHRRMLSENSHT